MKKFLPFLFFAAAAAGVALCIDCEAFRVARFVLTGGEPRFVLDRLGPDRASLTPRERFFAEAFLKGRYGETEWLEKQPKALLEDALFLPAYAEGQLARARGPGGTRADIDRFRRVTAELRRRDPRNALPDYLEASLEEDLALKKVWAEDRWRIELLDRAALERMVFLYRNALKKPYIRGGSLDVVPELHRMFVRENTPAGTLRKMACSLSGPLVFPMRAKGIAESILFYAELLRKEGRLAESRALLAGGEVFLCQNLECNSNTLIELLVWGTVGKMFRDATAKAGEAKLAEKYGRFVAAHEAWRSRYVSNRAIFVNGGIFANTLIPGGIRTYVSKEELEPERRLDYLFCDKLALAGFACTSCLCLLLCLAGAFFGRKRETDPVFSRLSWLRIIGYGMVTPLCLFILFIHLDMLSGRDLFIGINHPGFLIGFFGLVLLWAPLSSVVRTELRKLGIKTERAHCRAMLLPMACFLLLTGLCLRGLLDFEIRYWNGRETLFKTGQNVTSIEDRDAASQRAALIAALKNAKR